jgi:hypothetical protein
MSAVGGIILLLLLQLALRPLVGFGLAASLNNRIDTIEFDILK